MRANPLVCVEVDDCKSHYRWMSVVVFGRYEELPDTPDYERTRAHALEVVQRRPMWWQPAAIAADRREHRPPIFYRIHILRMTGRPGYSGSARVRRVGIRGSIIHTRRATAGGAAADELFGHPKGVYYLAFTEAWERFSYFGMISLLVLYMVDQLLLPGHAEHVVGLEALRTALESLQGTMSTQVFASQLFGLYSGFVYFTPLLGGVIGDRWTGQRGAVVIGAL